MAKASFLDRLQHVELGSPSIVQRHSAYSRRCLARRCVDCVRGRWPFSTGNKCMVPDPGSRVQAALIRRQRGRAHCWLHLISNSWRGRRRWCARGTLPGHAIALVEARMVSARSLELFRSVLAPICETNHATSSPSTRPSTIMWVWAELRSDELLMMGTATDGHLARATHKQGAGRVSRPAAPPVPACRDCGFTSDRSAPALQHLHTYCAA